jgi:hypothetical protein
VNLYVRHDELVPGLHRWLADLFAANHRERTIERLVEARGVPLLEESNASTLETRRQELRLRIGRLQDAIEAGADPAALVDRLNTADTDLTAVEAELAAQERDVRRPVVDEDDLREQIGSLSKISQQVFADADPAELAEFYRAIGLTVAYDHGSRTAEASVTLAPSGPMAAVGGELGVRGGVIPQDIPDRCLKTSRTVFVGVEGAFGDHCGRCRAAAGGRGRGHLRGVQVVDLRAAGPLPRRGRDGVRASLEAAAPLTHRDRGGDGRADRRTA